MTIEHPAGVNAYHLNYTKKTFSNLGHRRVLIIAKNAPRRKRGLRYRGVTHVSPQTAAQYGNPTAPVVSFKALNDR